MTDLTFKTKLMRPEEVGTWTFASISMELANRAQLRARMRIRGTIDGTHFRSSLMPARDGDVFVIVNKELREKIGKGNGEVVEMTWVGILRRLLTVFPDLKKALSQNAKAETYFRKMAPSHRKAYVQWIEQAKKAIHVLLQGKTLS
ncbi:MAG: YdeI/OmpD-associated family protein [Candidatus Nitrosopolaris sp.]